VAISDIIGALKNTSALNIPSIIRYSKENGNIKDFMEVDAIDTKCLLHGECDVLIPSSLWGNRLIFI
jgi:glutamate dehydrogenase/leucine dehydrogenase